MAQVMASKRCPGGQHACAHIGKVHCVQDGIQTISMQCASSCCPRHVTYRALEQASHPWMLLSRPRQLGLQL
jgi:hypothetical protein